MKEVGFLGRSDLLVTNKIGDEEMPNPLDGESYEGDINAWKDDNFELYGFKTVAVDGVNVHYMRSTGRAYNETQCNETISDGDVLVIESERVVGLAWTWPLAVTVEHGELHGLKAGTTLDHDIAGDEPKVVRGLPVARRIAAEKGWATIA